MPLADIKAVISDMDGVLWRGAHVLDGVKDFFTFLQAQSIGFILATNNAGKHPQDYVERLEGIGLKGLHSKQILTSGTTTADFLKKQYPQGTGLYVIGNAGLMRVLEEAGFELRSEHVAAVVVGIDFEFSYAKACTATLLIRNHGAQFIGANPDLTFPAPEGLVPGAGSIIKMIQSATDCEPLLMGKPYPAMFEAALARLGTKPHETLMLGDRLNTDIEGAQALGIQTAMVLTGVHGLADIEQAAVKPDYVFTDLPALLAAWENRG